MTSDARREPRGGLPSDQQAITHTDAHKNTAAPLTVNGSEVLILDAELEAMLRGSVRSTQAVLDDHERLAMALVDTWGPTWARRLASELEQAADDIAPRRPWEGKR